MLYNLLRILKILSNYKKCDCFAYLQDTTRCDPVINNLDSNVLKVISFKTGIQPAYLALFGHLAKAQ